MHVYVYNIAHQNFYDYLAAIPSTYFIDERKAQTQTKVVKNKGSYMNFSVNSWHCINHTVDAE